MSTESRQPRSFASVRQLESMSGPYKANVQFFRGLDEIVGLADHMTRRGIVQSFLAGFGGLVVGCAVDEGSKKGGGAADPSSSSTQTSGTTPGTGTGGTTSTDTTPTDTTTTETTTPEDCDTTTTTPPDGVAHDIGVWVSVGVDGGVTVAIAKNEMGQGIATAFAQLVAEELDVDWEAVDVQFVPELGVHDMPGFADGTWGSVSIMDNFDYLLEMGAAARMMLVSAAATRWGVDPATCTTALGEVSHPDHGSLGYGELAEEAAALEVPSRPILRDPETYRIIGQGVRRVDIGRHVVAEQTYGLDVQLPGMLYAAVKQAPSFGGEVLNFDELDLTGTGADAVVAIPNGVAVVASSWWVAQRALDGLDIEFSVPARMAGLTWEALREQFRSDLDAPGSVGRSDGRPDAAMAASETVIEAEYETPILAHMAMEPITATADVRADGADLWLGTQYAVGVRTAVSRTTGLPDEAITIHPLSIGGAFGRKAETDYGIQAAAISQAVGAPVKMIWSREEDVRHDYYRPPVLGRMTGGLDADGRIQSWIGKAAGCSNFFAAAPFGNLIGFDSLPYELEHFEARWQGTDAGIPFGYLRQPGYNKYTFMVESFMDELADAAGTDPAEFRLQHLEDGSRMKRVLEEVMDLASYGSPSVPGAEHGVSLLETGNRTFVAQVAEVSVDAKNKVTVHKVYVCCDIGRVINPDIVRSQVEGCIVFSMATGLQGRITLTDGAVDQGNFTDYGLIQMKQAPHVEVRIIDSDASPGGIGEHAVGGLMPAVTNALFRLTGTRVRTLPFTDDGFSL